MSMKSIEKNRVFLIKFRDFLMKLRAEAGTNCGLCEYAYEKAERVGCDKPSLMMCFYCPVCPACASSGSKFREFYEVSEDIIEFLNYHIRELNHKLNRKMDEYIGK